MRVVICGGGVIGACIAYFLARRDIDVIVVERTEVAAAASGKAGGFLARDWCAGSPLDALARRSFDLHAALPSEIAGDWGYRRMTAYSGIVVPERDRRRHLLAKLDWLSAGAIIESRLGTTETTAIVHPRAFTAAMMSAAVENSAELRHGRVTGIVRTADGSSVRGVEVDGGVFEADAVVVAMGPWSVMAAEWIVLPAVYGRRSPSLVYDTGGDIPADALFLEYQEETGEAVTVEVFPRANGHTLVTALSDEPPLPIDPAAVMTDQNEVDRLQVIGARLSPALRPEKVIARQACFRPITQDGLPLIGKVPQIEGAYVATGHSVWGILNAPATGEALAELLINGDARSTDLSPFDPARLRPLDPSRLRTSGGKGLKVI
ncbi:FAD-binding oxidoreductase [Bradyrhizobium sp. JYMT SZCCT0428]|uniref:NAD(P)/FAD-dependent oxidoreductase n=1 Tax=Bradyrhizobium sp. JYMT SZCCT0428 TaxID=2807673 RepID=UPI001BAB65A9|nr:FAD-dependent oxidoreductase [Bradyrhizobium sp. JYMT SZCCT0428]MBR1156282.1 FAD-binding oxidoreductase [Bradyrhizobium sp. JYMT SZCCT0428]